MDIIEIRRINNTFFFQGHFQWTINGQFCKPLVISSSVVVDLRLVKFMPYAESEVRVVKDLFVLLMWNSVKETMKYAKYAPVISHLLGETTVAEDLSTQIQAIKGQPKSFKKLRLP